MNKKKALFILHYSPPVHGASKVGDTIINSNLINNSLKSKYIKIKSSSSINEIGKFEILKIFYSIDLFAKVCYNLILHRPSILYYTTSPSGFAFYRDLIVSIPIKVYRIFFRCNIFFHYHSKGINLFTKNSNASLKLTNFFIKKVNIIFISNQMQKELENVKGFKKVLILKNGVEDYLNDKEFEEVIESRNKANKLNLLYLSNMMKAKGYDTALDLATKLISENYNDFIIHFAGSWSSFEDEKYFTNFVKANKLENNIIYHGLVQGHEKENLFKSAKMFIFPSRYKKEVFPLSVLEALSYGLPVLAFNAGAVSEIITDKLGVITDNRNLLDAFFDINKNYLNTTNYKFCRKTFLENYTLNVFETNLLKILNIGDK
jgi:glycosyltransferase involved in cell wall biosynthesis